MAQNKFLTRLRSGLQLPTEKMEAKEASLKRPPLDYKRRSFKPTIEWQGRHAIPVDTREDYDDYGMLKQYKRKHG